MQGGFIKISIFVKEIFINTSKNPRFVQLNIFLKRDLDGQYNWCVGEYKMQKKLALALGGGGGKCFVLLPLLQKLKDENVKIHHIAAGSSGTIIAALWAAGYSKEDILNLFLARGARFKWLGPTLSRKGFLTGDKMYRYMNSLLKKKHFKDLSTPCSFTVCDLTTGEFLIKDKGNVAIAVIEACAFPGVMVVDSKRNGHIMADGGIINLAPADICREKVGKDGVVVSSFLQGHFERSKTALDNQGKVLFRAISMALEYHKRKIVREYSDVVIDQFPDLPINITSMFKYTADLFDKKKINFYLKRGEKTTKHAWPKIKKLLYN